MVDIGEPPMVVSDGVKLIWLSNDGREFVGAKLVVMGVACLGEATGPCLGMVGGLGFDMVFWVFRKKLW